MKVEAKSAGGNLFTSSGHMTQYESMIIIQVNRL